MDSKSISGHIEELVAEEHRLFDLASERSLAAPEQQRLTEIQVQLDQYYDLLRQRRAREEFGQNPASAHLRAPETVEKYLQ
jgi:hypothetical protein